VLDLCCGFGRHALLLRERGLDVVGLDLSFDLLRAARTLPGFERLLAGRLLRGDAVRPPFRDERFDTVVNLFSSFGYFGEAGDERVLAGIRRILRPGGRAVFDLMNPTHVRAGLVARSRREEPEFVLDERRALLDDGKRVVKDVELAFTDGRRLRWREDVRLYDVAEFRTLANRHGLSIESTFGDFDGSVCGERSPRAIVFARRI
jgi:SAM-dependent methyltransferase